MFLFLAFFHRLSDCCQYSTGFCFGPCLINVFINDLCSVFHCFVYISFVGDISIFHVIKSSYDSNLLQSHIDSRRSCGTATLTLLKLQLIHHKEKRTFGCLHMNVMNPIQVLRLGGVFTDYKFHLLSSFS